MHTLAQVTSFTGPEKLPEALYGCALVVIPAGIPRKPGMTRDDLFNINASEPLRFMALKRRWALCM